VACQPWADLSAVCVAEWWTVLGKSGYCKEECKPIIIREAKKAFHLLPQGMLSNFCTSLLHFFILYFLECMMI